ncbi:zinc ribbon domain-containing protein [Streptomyces sp. NBC_01446]|uniref:zinc ribbon domain-containing protein n=1 Tax=Streptomyces sp. NBC_01446 TaxID=2903870 RepID=UPI002B1CCBD7|nr:zinc ribbon domain-containing protein [Streptomyces sp. NBC_01446]
MLLFLLTTCDCFLRDLPSQYQAVQVTGGTSQRCSACGFVAGQNRESQAVFRCKAPGCGHAEHADVNAAKNIRHAGGQPVSACGDLGTSRSVKQEPVSRATGRTPSQGNPRPSGRGGRHLNDFGERADTYGHGLRRYQYAATAFVGWTAQRCEEPRQHWSSEPGGRPTLTVPTAEDDLT